MPRGGGSPQTAVMLREAVAEDAEAIARVMVNTWRTTYPGLIDQGYLDRLSVADYSLRWDRILSQRRHSNGVFAVDLPEAGVVGFASCGRERDLDRTYLGELYAIYIEDAYQAAGWGRGLVAASARWLEAHGMRSMLVWVLRDNLRARGFYERLGGEYVAETGRPLGEIEIDEVSYGWLDTTPLIG